MRRVEDRYQSGLVNVQWIGECPACSAHARVAGEALARQWETAHAHYGCGHRLVRDETGRGWMPDQFATRVDWAADRSIPISGTVPARQRPQRTGRKDTGGHERTAIAGRVLTLLGRS